MFSIIAHNDLETASYDIPQAFVQAPLPSHINKYISLSGPAKDAWLQHYPQDTDKVNPAGRLLIKLHKFLYGMKDAPNAFYKHLFSTLSEKGYKVDFISDKCLVYKAYPNSDYFIDTLIS